MYWLIHECFSSLIFWDDSWQFLEQSSEPLVLGTAACSRRECWPTKSWTSVCIYCSGRSFRPISPRKWGHRCHRRTRGTYRTRPWFSPSGIWQLHARSCSHAPFLRNGVHHLGICLRLAVLSGSRRGLCLSSASCQRPSALISGSRWDQGRSTLRVFCRWSRCTWLRYHIVGSQERGALKQCLRLASRRRVLHLQEIHPGLTSLREDTQPSDQLSFSKG